MQRNYEKIQAAGLGLAAISYDSPETLRNFAARKGIRFPLLSDKDSKIIRSYGILNASVDRASTSFGIPYPGIYFLDKHGVVKAKYFEDNYRERQTAAVILMRQFGIQPVASHSSVSAKHLSLQASASDDRAHQGQHSALTLEVVLPPKVHVYAPGVQGYIAIEWKQSETPAVKPGAVEFPPAKILFLPAINEKVPVFQDRFRLSRDIVFGPGDPGPLTIQGTLRYQACDDEKCFLPETVPLSWTFQYEALDRIRAKQP